MGTGALPVQSGRKFHHILGIQSCLSWDGLTRFWIGFSKPKPKKIAKKLKQKNRIVRPPLHAEVSGLS